MSNAKNIYSLSFQQKTTIDNLTNSNELESSIYDAFA